MGWFTENSDAIVGIAAAVQAIFTVVLVGITRGYARSTQVIASETRGMATATERMTQLADSQRLDSTLPVVGFKLADGAQVNRFDLSVINMGVGPALDLTVTLDDSPMHLDPRGPLLPAVLPVGDSLLFRYWLSQERPFVDSALVSWPRNDEDQAVIDAASKSVRGGSGQIRAVAAAKDEEEKRFQAFLDEVRVAASEFNSAGTLRATYRDVHGRELVSRATLEATLDPKSDPEAWRVLSLGALKFVQPPGATV